MGNTSSFNPVADLGAVITLTAAGAGTTTSAALVNNVSSGVRVVVDITAATAATLTVTIQGHDAASGKNYTILASAALASVATTELTVYPTIAAVTNKIAQDALPNLWNISAVVTGTVTATIGACLLA